MTRAELDKICPLDGGMQGPVVERHAFTDPNIPGQYVKLRIVMRPFYMDEAVFKDHYKRSVSLQAYLDKNVDNPAGNGMFNPDDVVVGFSVPYIEGAIID